MQDQAKRLWLRVAFEEGRMRAFYVFLIASCILLAVFDAAQGNMVMCTAMLLCALANIFGLMNHMDGGRPS